MKIIRIPSQTILVQDQDGIIDGRIKHTVVDLPHFKIGDVVQEYGQNVDYQYFGLLLENQAIAACINADSGDIEYIEIQNLKLVTHENQNQI